MAASKEEILVVREDEDIEKLLERILTLRTPRPKRPDYGTKGKKISLIVNYFPVELPSGNIYHHDVKIASKKCYKDYTSEGRQYLGQIFRLLSSKKNREIVNIVMQKYEQFCEHKPAYDGQQNLYTKLPLKTSPVTFPIQLPHDLSAAQSSQDLSPKEVLYEVSIKPVCKKETNSNALTLDTLHEGKIRDEATMAVQIIMKTGPSSQYIPLGGSFFYPPQGLDDSHYLSGGKEIWYGYRQSLVPTQWPPVVSINITAAAFHKSGPVIECISDILGCRVDDLYKIPHLRDSDTVQVSRKLRDVRIKVIHLASEREYRILRVTREAANRLELPWVTNTGMRSMKVSDYFLVNYKMELQYPQLPCLQVHPEPKEVYFPLELCEILPGQPVKERMTAHQTHGMERVTRLFPESRFKEIQKAIKRADFNSDPYNTEFGIKVSSEPLSLEGRVIDPPSILYGSDRSIIPKDGSWKVKCEKFFKASDVSSWVLLSFAGAGSCNRASLERFSRELCRIAQNYGLRLPVPNCIDVFNGRHVRMRDILKKIHGRFSHMELAVVVMPGKDPSLYGELKKIADCELGFLTQCVKAAYVVKLNYSVMSNICQKINTKMGGINNVLSPWDKPEVFNRPVIIIGACIADPQVHCRFSPSIAAVVGSLDAHPSRYAATIRIQTYLGDKAHTTDMILDLEGMIVELMRAFYRNTRGKKPEKIIFYRCGVSESQFGLLDFEIHAVRNACRKLGTDYKPGLTFIAVQKTQRTRFKPEKFNHGVGESGNVPPGTVIDNGISSNFVFDFFLCSHIGLRGTSHPGHYTVIRDDNKFTSDELQELTYCLCYAYTPCTGSISIPAPVAYARLASCRASSYFTTELDGSSDDLQHHPNRQQEFPRIHPNLRDTMFFV